MDFFILEDFKSHTHEGIRMTTSSSVTDENISITVKAIKSFEEAKKFKDLELEELARKALLLQKTSDKDWLLSELSNFHENKKKEEEKEKVKKIKPTSPIEIKSPQDLEKVFKEHTLWMDSILSTGEMGSGTRANLKSADLAGFTLSDCNLSCANLNGVSFIGAKLNGVNFSRASLKKSSFEGASITNCSFHQTELKEADFRDADLSDTSFTEEQKKEAFGLF